MARDKRIDSISCDGHFEQPTVSSLPSSFVPGGRIPRSQRISQTIDCDDAEYRETIEKRADYNFDSAPNYDAAGGVIDGPPVLGNYVAKPIKNPPLEVGPTPDSISSNARLAQSIMDKIKASGIKQQITIKEPVIPPEPALINPPPKASGTDLSYETPNRWMEKTSSSNEIFADPEANPYKLYIASIDLWGDEWLDWEPETILTTAEIDGVLIDQVNLGKLFAIRSLLKTDEFFREPRIFEKICVAFSDKIVDFGVLQMPKLYEIAGTVALIEKKFRSIEYSDAVAIYTAMIAVDEGFLLLPPELNFAGASFNIELISRLGEETMRLQDNIISAMGSSDISQDEAIQYKRLMVCSYYIKNMLEGAK